MWPSNTVRRIRPVAVSSVVAILILLDAGTVSVAQETAGDEQVNEIEEIIVTARRREESLHAVPGSVSAFSESRLRDLQAADMRQVQYAVPNFHFQRSDSSNAAVYLRGIGQNDSLPFVESGVGVYIDDVYVARSQAAFVELFDIERVEVLRGPQGTLYGRNSPGGAVKLITRQPSDEFEAHAEVGAGSLKARIYNGRVSGPLSGDGRLKGKIAFSGVNRDGHSENAVLGGTDGDTNTLSFRSGLNFEASDNLSFVLRFEGKFERPDRSLTPIRKTPLTLFPDPVGAPFSPVTYLPTEEAFGSPYVVEGTANVLADLTTHGASFKIKRLFGDGWYVESVTAYRKLSWDFVLDADSTPHPVLDIPVYEDDDQFSTELRVAYESDSGLSFTGGFFYFIDDDVVLAGFDDASASFEFFGLFFPIISVGIPSGGYGESDQRTRSIAAFADVTFPVSDTTSVEIGARYTIDEKEVTRRGEFFFDPTLSLSLDQPPFLAGIGFPGENLQDTQDWNAVTPRAVLSHQPNDCLTLYGSVSRGFKSGGFPGRAFAGSEFKPFDPETVWTFETGIKGRDPDNRFTYSVAYFYNDYNDLQLNGFGQDPVTGQFVSLFTNAASAITRGLEGVVSYRPGHRLSIDASVGYLNAEYEEFETLVNGVLTDVSTRRLPNAPEWTGFLGVTYSDQLTPGIAGTVHVDVAYKGDHANESSDSPNLAVAAATYLNAFVSISASDQRWEVRLGGTNLTDNARAAQSFNTAEFSGVETAFMGAPRLYEVRLLLRFD